MLVDVAERAASTTALGETLSMGVLVAPTAFHAMAHEDGEAATARTASGGGTVKPIDTSIGEAMRVALTAGGNRPHCTGASYQ